MQIAEFQVRRDDVGKTRLASRDAPAASDGEILARVRSFALTANNITYAVVGERIGYWKFFPAEEGWGIVPAWGIGEVVESRHPAISKGERLYGYFPMATHLLMKPDKVAPARLVDAAAHRAGLPPVYNSYARLTGEPWHDPAMNDERMLLFPLYATSFCLYDFLKDNDWFGAQQIVIVSASSKTAIGLAYALQDDTASPRAIGLTAASNAPRVAALGLYDQTATYDRLAEIDNSKASVIVDMSGNGQILSALHAHLGDNMRYCSNVGVTHYDKSGMGPGFIGARSAMFFAPSHIQKRAADWGPGVFEKKALEFWKGAALKSRKWLAIDRSKGVGALDAAYQRVRAGKFPSDRGLIVEL